MQTRLTTNPKCKRSVGAYNKSNETEQWIRLSEGCPNNCPYCYEPTEERVFEIPGIIKNNVKIMDMNLLSKPNAERIIRELSEKRAQGKKVKYELICGIDYRFLTQEKSDLLKKSRFVNIRLAWDWFYKDQFKINDAIKMLEKSGYKRKEIMVFMLCNWKIKYDECCDKLDLLKIWGVQVADCYYDNQTFPNVVPIFWKDEELKNFRHKCRKHNQLINFEIDPELKN